MQNIFLQDIKLLQNKVLVEVVGKYDTNVKLGDTTIEVDKNYEKEKFIATSGIVRAVPAKLTFGKEPGDLEWETDMQLKVNDRVYMSYMGVASAMGDKGFSFVENGHTYCFVHYKDIIYASRNGVDILLNGYCLLKPILESEVPGYNKPMGVEIKSKFSQKFAKVIQCGEPNKRYVIEGAFDDPSVRVGQIICYLPIAGIKVYKSSQDLMTNRNLLLKVQRRYFLAIIN